MGGPGSRRPFAPFLGVLPVVVLLLVGVPAAVGVVWLRAYHGGGVALTAVTVGVVAAVLLGAAVWWAWRWATRDQPKPTAAVDAGPVVVPGRIWLVPEPGVGLLDSPWGGGVAARLEPGTEVTELNRHGGCLEVAAADESTGWVDARLLTRRGLEPPRAGAEPSEP